MLFTITLFLCSSLLTTMSRPPARWASGLSPLSVSLPRSSTSTILSPWPLNVPNVTVLEGSRESFKKCEPDHSMSCWELSMTPHGLGKKNPKQLSFFSFQKILGAPPLWGFHISPLFLLFAAFFPSGSGTSSHCSLGWFFSGLLEWAATSPQSSVALMPLHQRSPPWLP